MWALRRASSTSLRAQGLNITALRASSGLGSLRNHLEDKSSAFEPQSFTTGRWITTKTCNCSMTCNCLLPNPNQFSVGTRSLSSEAGAKSGGEEDDDLEDGFSELETLEASGTAGKTSLDGESTSDSESDLSDIDENIEEALETDLVEDAEVDEEKSLSIRKPASSGLFKLIMEDHSPSISAALDKYYAGDKELSRSEVYQVLLNLRKRKLFVKALQLSEWVEKRDDFDFSERDYASRVDLLAKVRGPHKAESYVDNIPKSYRNEIVYRTLLANFVSFMNVEKSEKVFNKMKDLGFPLTIFAYNQLLLLYKKTDKKKIADVLLMMEKEDLKPTLFTYQVLIDTKGQSNDIAGMDQIVETMKTEGVEPNIRVQATLARHYAAAGLKEKAEAVLKEIEGSDLKLNRWVCPVLLPIYADLGNAEEVERVWKVAESKPRKPDFLAAISAWGKLKNVEQAEAVFNKMAKASKKLSTREYTIMLKVYAANKMMNKGKELLKQMGDSGCHIGPVAWDALVKLYVDAGEVEKADSVLQKAAQHNNQRKPMFSSYMSILDQYSKRGDIHNAEKIFHRMRRAGYVSRARPFHALLQTYINAKVPAYGIRERMKADNIYPNKGLAAQLALVDAFRKTAVSELLD